jgi:hypothetical protein
MIPRGNIDANLIVDPVRKLASSVRNRLYAFPARE